MMKNEIQIAGSSAKALLLPALVILFLVGLSTNILAQTTSEKNFATVKGIVTELGSAKTPVEFATVQLLPQGSATTTSSKGEFTFVKVIPGKTEIKIQFMGMEPIDTVINFIGGREYNLEFKMQYSSFRLKEVSVVAQQSKAGQATASNISRQALDHLQAKSLSDVLQLMPGGVTSNSDFSTAKTFTIRNIGRSSSDGSAMNALGTAIIIDGAPVSNNANMQTLSPTITGSAGAVGGGTSPNSGFDLRSISTDNIESIEVIRGISSVEFGDLASGAVVVRSKAGKEPLSIKFKTDPSLYQVSAGKGISLGEKRGSLNLSGDYIYNVNELTESYAYYQRVNAKALYSNMFGKLSSNTSLGLSLGKDTREQNPNDLRSQLATGSSDLGITFNTNGTWNVNRGWLNNIQFTLSGSYRDKHSYSEQLLGNAFSAYSMSNSDGAVLSNRPGQKVYDNNGVELTNILPGESTYYASYLPNEYFSRYDIYGKEVNLFANLKATFAQKAGSISNRLVLGADFKTDGNLGRGKVYDLEAPPYRVLSSENSSPRPRKYSDIPFINQFSAYAEDNLNWSMGNRELLSIIGLRYDNFAGKSIVSPRINLTFEVIPSTLWFRGGMGVFAKAPTALYLYPQDAYFDMVHFNNIGSSTVPEAEQLFLASTKVYQTDNSNLKIASNRKTEIGFDLKFNKKSLSVTAFNEDLINGYRLGTTTETYKLVTYKQYEIAQTNTGTIPTLKEKSTNKIFLSYATPQNNARSISKGVEFDLDLGRIDAIRTSFVISGAYMNTVQWNDGYSFSTNKNLNSLERNIGIYERANQKDHDERLVSTLRIIHNIPSIGFVITATAQINWIDKSWSTYGNDTMLVAYISRADGLVHAFDPIMKNDPEFSYLFSSKSSTRFIAESYFPTVIMNFNLTKEIGETLKASFYANNMFNVRPLYESKRTPGSFTRLNIPLYFGFELALKIK